MNLLYHSYLFKYQSIWEDLGELFFSLQYAFMEELLKMLLHAWGNAGFWKKVKVLELLFHLKLFQTELLHVKANTILQGTFF